MLGFSCQNTQDKTSKRLHLSPITREKGPAFELSFCNLYSRKQYKLLFPANLDFPFLGYNTNYEKNAVFIHSDTGFLYLVRAYFLCCSYTNNSLVFILLYQIIAITLKKIMSIITRTTLNILLQTLNFH